ncbi:hypothetical protein SNE40_023750 [Patella caerulea]|uniref:Uncharacterized protein n=1 Tax=Patella caerulea TaxID=87958 RepID=A0AAN8IZ93_PATCE
MWLRFPFQLTLANKKQGPATKLPLPTGNSPLHLLAPANIDVNSSSKPSSYTIQKNRNGSGSRWALEDAMFHNDCNLMTTRSGAPSSGHSGKRFIQFSANSLHRVPISSALSSSSSSTMRVNSGHHSGVSPVISAQSTTDDFIQSG